jgi:tetratricopeptide (TPR) repeat protein
MTRTATAWPCGSSVLAELGIVAGEHRDVLGEVEVSAEPDHLMGTPVSPERITFLEDEVGIWSRAKGPDHQRTVAARGDLALGYHRNGRTDEALALIEQNIESMIRVQGFEDPGTQSAYEALTVQCVQVDRLDRAAALQEDLLLRREEALGPQHPYTLASRHTIAALRQEMERESPVPAEAPVARMERRLVTLLTGRERVLGKTHPATMMLYGALSGLYGMRHEPAKAIALLTLQISLIKRTGAQSAMSLLDATDLLGHMYLESGDARKAVKQFRSALDLCGRVYGPYAERTFDAYLSLANAYEAKGDLKKAARQRTLLNAVQSQAIGDVLGIG